MAGKMLRSSRRRLSVETLESRTQPAALQPLRVALISDAVAQAGQVEAAAAHGVLAITYDAAGASLDSLVGTLQGISTAHGGAPIGRLGLVAHGRPGTVDIGTADTLDMQDVTTRSEVWSDLRSLLTPNARIDLYACDVAAGSSGKAFVDAIATQTGADIYASTDAVGTGKGADLVWEYRTGVRGASPLFKPAALKKIHGLVLEDGYAPNQVKADADRPTGANSPNFGVLTSTRTVSNLQLVAGKPDWFRFDTSGVATTDDYVRIEFLDTNGNLDLYVFEQDGTNYVGWSESNTNVEEVSLAGKPAGTYYIAVYGRNDTVGNPNYTLQVVAPPAAADDVYAPNQTKADADRPAGVNSPNLGVLTGTTTLTNLMVNGNNDWFKFKTSAVGTVNDYVRLQFLDKDGNLDLYVFEQDGTNYVGWSESNTNTEQVSLAGKPAGTYYILVQPRAQTLGGNPNYTLQVVAPAAASDDPFENNDAKSDADRPTGLHSPNLGQVAGSQVLKNLVDDGDRDWFRIETTQASTVGNYVRLDFQDQNGNLDLYVYEQDGSTFVGWSESNTDTEQVSLAGKPAGTYYILVQPRALNLGGNPNYTLQILAPGSGASVESVLAKEGDAGLTPMTFTVTRGDGAGAASVQYSTVDGSAVVGTDYDSTSGTLNFANGETQKSVTVMIHGDKAQEADETLFLNLSNPVGMILNTFQAVGTILNDDQAGILQFSAPTYSVSESVTTAFVKVTRTGGSDGQVTVHYSTDDGSAVAPDDYAITTGTLTFNTGETSKTIGIPIVNDSLSESDETINLVLTNPIGGAALGDQSTSELIILANDRQAGILQFSAPSYSVSEGVGRATITVNRIGGDDGTVTVKYTTGNRIAIAPGDYTADSGVLTFADGDTSQSFDIEIVDDGMFETNEQFRVTLSAATGGAKLGAPRTAAVTIANDDVLMTRNTIVAGAGNSGLLKVFDATDGTVKASIQAYPVGFTAGVRVATGDVTGDGVPDIIVAPGANGATSVRVFDGTDGQQLAGTQGEIFVGLSAVGMNVAAGDVNGDSRADIIVGAGAGAGPHVRVFSGIDRSVLADFDVFAGSSGEVSVAVGDVTGGAANEIIVGSPTGGVVNAYDAIGAVQKTYDAFPGSTGGISVAAGDVDGDSKADIIVGSGAGASPSVRVLKGTTGADLLSPIVPYSTKFKGGVRVAAGDVNGDGIIDQMIVGGGIGSNQKVKVYDLSTGLPVKQHSPFGRVKTNGVFVAGVK